MLIHRPPLQLTRRALAHPPSKSIAPLGLSTRKPSSFLSQTQPQTRLTSTTPTSTHPTRPSDAYSILAAQRLNRPISPHLSIYRPQLTWYLSALNRITGSLLSGGFYLFGAAYLFAPLFGWHLESVHLAEAFGNLHPVVKGVLKFAVGLPFWFHGFNGVRHLVWDLGRELGNKQVVRTGWVVVAGSVLGSAVFAVYPWS